MRIFQTQYKNPAELLRWKEPCYNVRNAAGRRVVEQAPKYIFCSVSRRGGSSGERRHRRSAIDGRLLNFNYLRPILFDPRLQRGVCALTVRRSSEFDSGAAPILVPLFFPNRQWKMRAAGRISGGRWNRQAAKRETGAT